MPAFFAAAPTAIPHGPAPTTIRLITFGHGAALPRTGVWFPAANGVRRTKPAPPLLRPGRDGMLPTTVGDPERCRFAHPLASSPHREGP